MTQTSSLDHKLNKAKTSMATPENYYNYLMTSYSVSGLLTRLETSTISVQLIVELSYLKACLVMF